LGADGTQKGSVPNWTRKEEGAKKAGKKNHIHHYGGVLYRPDIEKRGTSNPSGDRNKRNGEGGGPPMAGSPQQSGTTELYMSKAIMSHHAVIKGKGRA